MIRISCSLRVYKIFFRNFTVQSQQSSIELRPYQKECIETCLEEYSKGIRRQAVSLPVVFANLINQLPDPRPEANKVLVLAHREELLSQASRQISRFAPHLKVSIEKGHRWSDHENDDVIIASVPTLGRRDSGTSRLERFDPKRFKAIIIDEAHHSVAETYLRILKYFGVGVEGGDHDKSSDLLVWGCSATFSRNDELELGKVFEKIVYHLDIKTLMDNEWLCPVEMKQIFTDINLQKVSISYGDFDTRQLSLAIDTPDRNALVAGMWRKIAQEEHDRKSTIVFGLTIEHVKNLAKAFDKLGVKNAIITGETSDEDREETLIRFGNREIPVLLNCAVLTEGTDLPATDCIVMTRPTCNSNLYTQMVGRGLRKHAEKEYCLVLDFIDKYRSGNRSIITFPSLISTRKSFEKSNSEETDLIDKDERNRSKEELDVERVDIKVKNLSMKDQIADLGGGLAWVWLDDGHYLLSCNAVTIMVRLNDTFTAARAYYIIQEKLASNKKTTFKLEPLHVEEWIKLYQLIPLIKKDLEEREVLHLMQPRAMWRTRRPITSGQKVFLYRILSRIPGIDAASLEGIGRWSVGKASDLISKYLVRMNLLGKPFSSYDELTRGVPEYR